MRIYMYLNEKEKSILKTKCKKLNISQSSYVREVILNLDYIENKQLLKEFLNTNKLLLENLHRIGSNINQIAYALNINVSQSDESIAFEMRELKKLLQEYKDFMMTSKFPKLLKKRKFGNRQCV